MCCGGCTVDLQRPQRRLLRSWASFAWWKCSKRRGGHAVRVGDADIGEGVIGIKLSRLLIIFDAFSQAVFCPLIPEVAATQVELIGFGIPGRALDEILFLTGELYT